ncbi:TetR/AcrR family transcriptional regulator [Novosphingobium sp.]|uniref:TetR/AcrR family transcriptional regulator n=1 Tax=Novosphingobium sp. TaxID=1874826 RepID=UPI003BABBE40
MSDIGAIKFTTYLEALALEIRKVRSGEKTSLKLLAAGARLLDNVGYRDLNVEEISAEAGLAKGTFYIYFKTKDEFLIELARRFVAFEPQTLPSFSPRETAFRNTLALVTWYERGFLRNVGILRCIIQMGETDDAMRELWQRRNRIIAEHAWDGTLARFNNPALDPALLMLAVRTVGGMMDQSLFNRTRVQTDTGEAGEGDADPEFLCRFHALLIYRAVYAHNPPDPEVADLVAAIAGPTALA